MQLSPTDRNGEKELTIWVLGKITLSNIHQGPCQNLTAWKVSVFGVILVRIFPHLDWITSNTDTFCALFILLAVNCFHRKALLKVLFRVLNTVNICVSFVTIAAIFQNFFWARKKPQFWGPPKSPNLLRLRKKKKIGCSLKKYGEMN